MNSYFVLQCRSQNQQVTCLQHGFLSDSDPRLQSFLLPCESALAVVARPGHPSHHAIIGRKKTRNHRLQRNRRRFAFLQALASADYVAHGYVIRFKSKSACGSLSFPAQHRRVTGRRSAQQPTSRCSSCRSMWTVPYNRKQWGTISYRCC
jgi:hypothetical protein